jgi:hypothetical protein
MKNDKTIQYRLFYEDDMDLLLLLILEYFQCSYAILLDIVDIFISFMTIFIIAHKYI